MRSLPFPEHPVPHWIVALAVAMFLPLSFDIGALSLSPYRVVLLAASTSFIGPFIFVRKNVADWCVLVHVGWVVLSLMAVHGPERAVESGGVLAAELLGAYLIARMTVWSIDDAKAAVRCLFLMLLATLPLAAIEFTTGRRILVGLLGGSPLAYDMRLGFYRVYGPFNHPILYGCFCASMLGCVVYANKLGRAGPSFMKRVGSVSAICAGAIFGLTSGGLIVLCIQGALCVWDSAVRFRHKWLVLLIGCVAGYLVVSILADRPAYLAVLSRVTFEPQTLYYRTQIFGHGIQNVWAHPFFGIGFNEWTRPEWMASSSVDNFWLLVAMRHGLPAFLSIALAVVSVLVMPVRSGGADTRLLLTGARFSVAAIALAGTTVHLWGAVFTHFAFLIGFASALIEMPRGNSANASKPQRSRAPLAQ